MAAHNESDDGAKGFGPNTKPTHQQPQTGAVRVVFVPFPLPFPCMSRSSSGGCFLSFARRSTNTLRVPSDHPCRPSTRFLHLKHTSLSPSSLTLAPPTTKWAALELCAWWKSSCLVHPFLMAGVTASSTMRGTHAPLAHPRNREHLMVCVLARARGRGACLCAVEWARLATRRVCSGVEVFHSA
jgi:hypothetical protein